MTLKDVNIVQLKTFETAFDSVEYMLCIKYEELEQGYQSDNKLFGEGRAG